MKSIKLFFANIAEKIFSKTNSKQTEYSKLDTEKYVWMPLKNVDYGYGFINIHGRKYLVFQFPYYEKIDRQVQQEFVKAMPTLRVIYYKVKPIVDQLKLANEELHKHNGRLPEQIQAQYFNEKGIINVLYESLRNLGDTRDAYVPKKHNHSNLFHNVSYHIVEIPPLDSCTDPTLKRWTGFVNSLAYNYTQLKKVTDLKGKGVVEYQVGCIFHAPYDI